MQPYCVFILSVFDFVLQNFMLLYFDEAYLDTTHISIIGELNYLFILFF